MWVKKEMPIVKGYESSGDNVRAKRWLDFRLNELLDIDDPVLEYAHKLRTIKEIAEFVITQVDYPLKFGKPTDKHYNNWFGGLCCHKITEDFWQRASETLRTVNLNKKYGKKGFGDCEDTSILFTTLMLQNDFNAYEIFGAVYRGDDLLGGHGFAIFEDENGIWRLYESTLDIPPSYPDGYPKIDPQSNEWSVGDITYVGYIKFNRKEYYEWETEGINLGMDAYLDLSFKEKETRYKYEALQYHWDLPVTPIVRTNWLSKLRWRR
ncbi:MAG TPA: hypothetical protein ENI14_03035 [Thermoplasmatales archaeon]|nr:hypothetical protein [Thermoplasmatales archaeon]